MLSIILLIIVFAILIVTTLMGHRKGFLRLLFSFLPLLLGFVLVYFLSGPVTTTVESMTNVKQSVTETIDAKLHEITTEKYAESDEEQKQAIEDSFMPEALVDSYEECDNFVSTIGDDYATRLAAYIGDLAVKLLGIVITVILAFIIIKVVIYLLGIMNHIPFIGGINSIAGGILGLAFGLLIVSLFFYLITAFASTDFGMECLTAIKENPILNFLYNGAFSIINLIL